MFTLSLALGSPPGRGCLALAYCLLLGPLRLHATEPAPEIAVGPNVHLSRAHAGLAHIEPILAADPRDRKRLLAGAIVRGKRPSDSLSLAHSLAYVTFDGGASWSVALEPRTRLNYCDPAVAYGPDGSCYFSTMCALLYRSPDSGKSWGAPVRLAADERPDEEHPSDEILDRPTLSVDCTGGRYGGRVYSVWVSVSHALGGTAWAMGGRQQGVALYRSADAGRSFLLGVRGVRMPLAPFQVDGLGSSAVLSDGTLVVACEMSDHSDHYGRPAAGGGPKGKVLVLRSSNGGEAFDNTGLAGVVARKVRRDPADRNQELFPFPCLAAVPGTGRYKDRLFMAWSDLRDGLPVALCAWSADKGTTWSLPRVVSDLPQDRRRRSQRRAEMPNVAANKDGTVAVTWYDTRDVPEGQAGWDVRMSATTDGGRTWSPSVKVTEKTTTFKGGAPAGETTGLAADAAGAFHALWIDTRTGVPQVWTATATVRPRREKREGK